MSEPARVAAPLTVRAEISAADPDTCKFTLGQSLGQSLDQSPGRSAEHFFPSPAAAAGSPLVERLFELAGVAHVLVADTVLAVGKSREADWAVLKPQIAAVVRSQMRSGVPPILRAPQPPGGTRRSDTEIRALVQALLDEEVNPSVAAHGGAIAILDLKDGRLAIEMRGGCQGCAGSKVTLRQGFERMVRRLAPEVLEIVDVTDHAAGQAPYHRSAPGGRAAR